MEKKQLDHYKVIQKRINETSNGIGDNVIICRYLPAINKYKELILTTTPSQWNQVRETYNWHRMILNTAIIYIQSCPKSEKPKVDRTIKAIANKLDKYNLRILSINK